VPPGLRFRVANLGRVNRIEHGRSADEPLPERDENDAEAAAGSGDGGAAGLQRGGLLDPPTVLGLAHEVFSLEAGRFMAR